MKKRVIHQLLGASLLLLALAGSLAVLRSLPENVEPQADTQTEIRMENAISVLP